MSDNTPTFNDVLSAIGTLLNVDSTNLFDELFEDVELARIAFVKKSKAESAENADDYSAVDEALDQLGVDKPGEDVADDVDGTPLSTWRITPPHDEWSTETVEAETLDIDPIEGIHAYIGDDLVFHAPAGTYSYVRKVG